MKSVYILLNSIDKVKDFSNTALHIHGDLDLVYDRYVVDAKSILDIFSLNLSQPLRLDIHDESHLDETLNQLKPYLLDDQPNT